VPLEANRPGSNSTSMTGQYIVLTWWFLPSDSLSRVFVHFVLV
jgi:hypothetical protein